MGRFRFLAKRWWRTLCEAWWDAWLGLWMFVADELDPDAKRDARACERDCLDADVLDRCGHGGFASSSGGDW